MSGEQMLTAEEIAQRAEAGDLEALRESQAHPEAWREMTDEEIMATKISLRDGCFGLSVLLYAVPVVLFIGLFLAIIFSGLFA